MDVITICISACITIFSLGLLWISLASYRKYRNIKLLVVSLVFVVFFIRGILFSLSLFYKDMVGLISSGIVDGLIDLSILVLLFIATLKR
ncbi:MAG: hypothetical protein NT038_07750 [Euryarchaeota archaeon]|nr:hypothetical protein [Euryarchaeota archaeon]